jgi:tRNA nucleotidyltransferase (CCA-adding enzyme)
MEYYLVGGAVRDKLLNRQVKDRDWVVVGATPEYMLQHGYQSVGADFPVFLHPKTNEEYALARTERKTAKGYNGFECDASQHITLEQDLLRRDLTINAMAMDNQGNIIDPYNGQRDITDRILRHVSDAFVEDPLRVLRVARFAARFTQLGFIIAPETMALMQTLVLEDELSALSAERVWQETARSLLEDNPEVYFDNLRACGALKVWFTELDNQWTPDSTLALQQAVILSEKLTIRFAALVHDLGQDLNTDNPTPTDPNQVKLCLEAINQLCQRLKVPNECRELALMVCEYHEHIQQAFALTPQVILAIFDRCDIWRKPERFMDFLITCKAIIRVQEQPITDKYANADFIWQAYLAAHKVDVQGIVAKGFQGRAIREQLDHQRIIAISEFKQQDEKPL